MVYDPVGGDFGEPAVRSMAWNGRYLVIGFASGLYLASAESDPLKGCALVGVFWGRFWVKSRGAAKNVEELWGCSTTASSIRS